MARCKQIWQLMSGGIEANDYHQSYVIINEKLVRGEGHLVVCSVAVTLAIFVAVTCAAR